MKKRVQFLGGKMIKEHEMTPDGEVCDARYLEDIQYRLSMDARLRKIEEKLSDEQN